MTGWVMIYRNLIEHWVWNTEYLQRWIAILLSVNYKAQEFYADNKVQICHPGQSFISLVRWANIMCVSKATVKATFKVFEEQGMIICKTIGSGNRRKHLLTVVNWEEYQKNPTENYPEIRPEFSTKTERNLVSNKNRKNRNKIIREKETINPPSLNEFVDKETGYEYFVNLDFKIDKSSIDKYRAVGYTDKEIHMSALAYQLVMVESKWFKGMVKNFNVSSDTMKKWITSFVEAQFLKENICRTNSEIKSHAYNWIMSNKRNLLEKMNKY